MKLERLPPWVLSDEESVWRETAESRRMTPDQRAVILAGVCRAGAKLLAMNDRRDRIIGQKEAPPPSTVAALARLRLAMKGSR